MNITNMGIADTFDYEILADAAEELSMQYDLRNSHVLNIILSTIAGFRNFYWDSGRDLSNDLEQIAVVRAELQSIIKSSRRILSLEHADRLGGALMSLSEVPDVFSSLHTLDLIRSAQPSTLALVLSICRARSSVS